MPPLDDLLGTIHRLRSPDGCPWDRRQDLASASHHLLDEAAELLEAALRDDLEGAVEELADLLFMVCFCREILSERRPVEFQAIARLGNEKLVRRHPHVFGEKAARDAAESQERWNEVKAAERQARGLPERSSILKDLPASSSPLHQARQYQKDAAEVGFDWPDLEGVWAKLAEETGELREAAEGGDQEAVVREMGDLLFAAVNLSRRLGVRPDNALRLANRRFRDRFQRIEAAFGNSPARLREAGLEALDAEWERAKAADAPPPPATGEPD